MPMGNMKNFFPILFGIAVILRGVESSTSFSLENDVTQQKVTHILLYYNITRKIHSKHFMNIISC